jgi:hypothetical protein
VASNFTALNDYAMLRIMRFRMNPQKHYLIRGSAWMIAGLLYTSNLSAQIGTESMPVQDIGRPPEAPFITFLGIVTPGKLVTDPSLPPVGPIVQTVYEELRAHETTAGPAGEVMTSITSTWDEGGRVIEVVRNDQGSESDTINRYDGTRLVSQESTFPSSRKPKPKRWNYWRYDESGKLIDYRRGSGDQLENHVTNFKRDAHGRLTSYEYRQGPKDELFSRTEFTYSVDGRTVDLSQYEADGAVIESYTQTVDDQGHVVMAVIRDWRTKQMKNQVKVAFRYDGTGRLIEQDTDAHEFDKSGSEGELPPGKISIAYDDVKHTKTTSYSGDEGLLAFTETRNASGATIGFVIGAEGMSRDAMVHCTDDSHGNWTACQQIVNAGGVDRVEKMWRRKTTYR